MAELPATETPRLAPSPRRRWLWVAAAILSVSVVAAIGAPLWLRSEMGRRTVASRLEAFVSDGIAGSMSVGSVESISLDGIVAADVRFDDPSGTLVIAAERVTLDVEWMALLFEGRFVSPHGRVNGARVVLETLDSGELTISRAFAPASPGPAGAPVGPDTVHLEGLVASDVVVVVTIDGVPGIRAAGVSAILVVRAPENGSIRLRADRIDGEVHIASPIPVDLTLDDGTLSIDGAARRRAVIGLPTAMNGEDIAIDVVVRAEASGDVRVEVTLAPADSDAVLVSAPLLAQALLAGVGTDALEVTIEAP